MRAAPIVVGVVLIVLAVWLVPDCFNFVFGPPIQAFTIAPAQDANPLEWPGWWPSMWMGDITFQMPLMSTFLVLSQALLLTVGIVAMVYGCLKKR